MNNQELNTNTPSGSGGDLLGEYLKQKRIEKNYSLEKLSQKTKISVNILKALESNDYQHMPSAAYIKGFVTSYVKVIGSPLDEAIEKMEQTYKSVLGKPFPALNHTKTTGKVGETLTARPNFQQAKTNTDPGPTPAEVIDSGETIIEHTKSFLPIAIFALVVLLFVGGYKLISSVIEDEVDTQQGKDLGPKIESSAALVKKPAPVVPAKPETPPAGTTPAVEPVAPTAPVPAPAVPVDAATAPATAPVAAPIEVVKPEPEFVRNFPDVNFKKITEKLFTVRTDAPENNDPEILPAEIKSAMNSDLQNVYIRAKDGNTWLSYKIDKNPVISVIINQGMDLLLQGNEIRVFLGNVNVTKIFYNNFLIETPNKAGVKSLVFPEESNAKFVLPLFPKAKDYILYSSEDYIKRMDLEKQELAKRQKAKTGL